MSREMSDEVNQRRAVSILVLLGSILFVAVAWNYRSEEAARCRQHAL